MQTRHQDAQYIKFNQRAHTEHNIKQQLARIIISEAHENNLENGLRSYFLAVDFLEI